MYGAFQHGRRVQRVSTSLDVKVQFSRKLIDELMWADTMISEFIDEFLYGFMPKMVLPSVHNFKEYIIP